MPINFKNAPLYQHVNLRPCKLCMYSHIIVILMGIVQAVGLHITCLYWCHKWFITRRCIHLVRYRTHSLIGMEFSFTRHPGAGNLYISFRLNASPKVQTITSLGRFWHSYFYETLESIHTPTHTHALQRVENLKSLYHYTNHRTNTASAIHVTHL